MYWLRAPKYHPSHCPRCTLLPWFCSAVQPQEQCWQHPCVCATDHSCYDTHRSRLSNSHQAGLYHARNPCNRLTCCVFSLPLLWEHGSQHQCVLLGLQQLLETVAINGKRDCWTFHCQQCFLTLGTDSEIHIPCFCLTPLDGGQLQGHVAADAVDVVTFGHRCHCDQYHQRKTPAEKCQGKLLSIF